jgi:2-keto-4-pentenoate hydratase
MATDDLDHRRIDTLAHSLIAARRDRAALGPPDPESIPANQAEAEAVDDRVAELTGWPVLGWKIGCTSAHAQELLGADGPFAGRVYTVDGSGITLATGDLAIEPLLEGEFAFTIAADVAPNGGPRSPADLMAALADVRPAIEVVGGRYRHLMATPLMSVIADAGANIRLVLGPPMPVPAPDVLAATAARMEVDGALTGSGTGADVLGGPLRALGWLIDNLSSRGITLAAGQVVTTGTATQVTRLPPGSVATLILDGIGTVTARSRLVAHSPPPRGR